MKVKKLEKMIDTEKSIRNTTLFLRKGIVDMQYRMQWPPRTDDFNVEKFTIPKIWIHF